MSNEIILPPSPDDPENNTSNNSGEREARRARNRRRGRLLTDDEIRGMLAEIPTLVILKVISPAQANAMTRSLQVLLSSHRTSPSTGTVQVNEDMIAVLRSRPELLHLLEPFLSDDQIDRLLGGDSNEPV